MKKRLFVIMAVTLAVTMLAGCGKKRGGDEAPSPSPGTQAVVMTAPPETEAPAGQTYGSMANLLAITLPDGTWLRQEDTYNKMRFQSAGRGDIYVLQGSIWDEGGIKMPEAAAGVRDLLKAVNYVGAYETVSFTTGSAVWVDTFEAELKLTPADVATQYKSCVMYGAQNSESVVIAVGMIASEDQKDKDMLLASLRSISKGTEEEISALQTSPAPGSSSGSQDSSSPEGDAGSSSDQENSSDTGYSGEDGAGSGEGDDASSGDSDTGDAGTDDGSSDWDSEGDGESDAGDEGSSDGSEGTDDYGSEGEDSGEGDSWDDSGSYDDSGEEENYE